MPKRDALREREQSTRCRTDDVRLAVEGIQLDAVHGVYEAERTRPQTFEIDVEIQADIGKALTSDRLEDTVDHAAIVDLVEEVGRGREFNLIESLAHAISGEIIDRFPRVTHVRVSVRKIAPYNLGSTTCTRAEISVSRK